MNLAPVADLLDRRIGLDVASLGDNVFRAAAIEHMRALELTDPLAYAGRLGNQPEEFDKLMDRLVVPETWFFRGGELFGFLAREIAAFFRTSSENRTFRILSLPCSTGEEPYSLAMVLLDAGLPVDRWRIDAVDLSRRFIEAASRGIYREFSFRQTSPEMRTKYFRPAGSDWRLDPSVQSLVNFRVGNVLDAALLESSAYDLILCRNLLIYLTREARLQAILNLERLLTPNGLLGVGHAEPQVLAGRAFQRFGPESCFLFQHQKSGETSKNPEEKPAWIPSVTFADVQAAPSFSGYKASAGASTSLPNQTKAETPKPEFDSPVQHARRLADLGRLDDALTECQAHLTQAGPSADGFSLLGVIHQARGDQRAAGEAYRKALYLDPTHREALTHAMLLCSRTGDDARAAALRERLARIGKGDEP